MRFSDAAAARAKVSPAFITSFVFGCGFWSYDLFDSTSSSISMEVWKPEFDSRIGHHVVDQEPTSQDI